MTKSNVVCEPHKYYELIKKFYGDRKAIRSQIPYMQHINEGFWILDIIGAFEDTKSAFCIHPIVQADEDFLASQFFFMQDLDPWVIILAMEYRAVANAYLSDRKINSIDEIKLSPSNEVNKMLIADKIQNYKDFSANKHLYDNANELELYFNNWFKRLNITPELYNGCLKYIEKTLDNQR